MAVAKYRALSIDEFNSMGVTSEDGKIITVILADELGRAEISYELSGYISRMKAVGRMSEEYDYAGQRKIYRIKVARDKRVHPFRSYDRDFHRKAIAMDNDDDRAALYATKFNAVYGGAPSKAAMYMLVAARRAISSDFVRSYANLVDRFVRCPVFLAIKMYGHVGGMDEGKIIKVNRSIPPTHRPDLKCRLLPLGLAQLKLACKNKDFKAYYDAFIPPKVEESLVSSWVDAVHFREVE